jgi:hypothetical protein
MRRIAAVLFCFSAGLWSQQPQPAVVSPEIHADRSVKAAERKEDPPHVPGDGGCPQSRFSSGWAVTVNFSLERTYAAGAAAVRPESYRIYRWNSQGER